MIKTRAIFALPAVLLTATALAQAADTSEPGRYSMLPAEGGFIRLDRQTGAMTFCGKPDPSKSGPSTVVPGPDWSCAPMGDSQQSATAEISRLEDENKALKADKKHLEEMLGIDAPGKQADAAPKPGTTPSEPGMKVPSEQDVDRAFDYFEGMLRKFRERMKKLDDPGNPERQL